MYSQHTMSRKVLVFLLLPVALLMLNACAPLIKKPIEPSAGRVDVNQPQQPTSASEPAITGRLILRGAGITELPKYVLEMTNLEELDISDNALTGALPAEIRKLQKLRILDASGNKMTGVPAEIGQLSQLEQLDLSNNQLTGLPYELGNLQNLRTLILSGNQYSEQDLATIREKLPQTKFVL